MSPAPLIPEKNFRLAFLWSLYGKGFFAFVEIVGGVLVYFVSQKFLYALTAVVTQNEITGGPNDLFSHYLQHLADNFSIGTQHFTALYLISHGVVKLFLIAGLLKQRLWAYPAALTVFTLFIVYQLYRFTVTQSAWLIAISIFDLFVILLTWHEWRYVKANPQLPLPTDSQG